jgi:hypothetical protein
MKNEKFTYFGFSSDLQREGAFVTTDHLDSLFLENS